MTDSQGGFYAAEDADSEGQEGKFYVWRPEEIIQALGQEEGELVKQFYGVRPEGNFEQGASILHIEQPIEPFATLKGYEPTQLAHRLAQARDKLLAARSRRIRPHRDDKILTSWNGLMIASLAYGARVLNEPRYLEAAKRAAQFVLTSVRRDGQLLRRYRDGEARYAGTLEDYAFLSLGGFELYEASLEPRWLASAKELAQEMIRLFWDEQEGGLFLRSKKDAPLIARSKEVYDGALPSGNSIATLVLLKLGRLTADESLEAYGRRVLEVSAKLVDQNPFAYPQLLIGWDVALGPTKEIVVAGDPRAPETTQMIQVIHQRFLPRTVLAFHPALVDKGGGVQGPGQDGSAVEALIPYIKTQQPLNGKPTAYVCENYICNLPATRIDQLEALLERGS